MTSFRLRGRNQKTNGTKHPKTPATKNQGLKINPKKQTDATSA